MSGCGCGAAAPANEAGAGAAFAGRDRGYRRVLSVIIALNAAMFVIGQARRERRALAARPAGAAATAAA